MDMERKQMYSNGKSIQRAETPLFPDTYITAFRYQYDFKEQKYKQLPSIQKPIVLFCKQWDRWMGPVLPETY